MTPYLLKHFHNTQHVLPQFKCGQVCEQIQGHIKAFSFPLSAQGVLALIFTSEEAAWAWIRPLAEEGSLPAVLLVHSKLTWGTACLTCFSGFSFNYKFNIGLNTVAHLKSDGEKTSQIYKTEGGEKMSLNT